MRLPSLTGSSAVVLGGSHVPMSPHRHLGLSEIYIIKGDGHHEQAGDFKTGDYVIEPDGAVHSALVFEQEVVQIMMAQGPSAFLAEDGSTTFLMDVDMLSGFADDSVLARA